MLPVGLGAAVVQSGERKRSDRPEQHAYVPSVDWSDAFPKSTLAEAGASSEAGMGNR